MVNILQWNVRSFPARLPSIQHLISSYKCSVILISETWLLPSRNCFIPHINLFRQDRVDGYGGVAIATHTSLNVSLIEINHPLKQLLLENNIDLIGLKISNIDGSPNTSFWSCYSPNDSPIPFEIWHSLFQLADHNSFFTGDLNAHHPAWGSISSTRRGNLIYDALNSANLNILNNGSPTHVGRPNSTNSCIGLSLTTPNLFWLSTWRIYLSLYLSILQILTPYLITEPPYTVISPPILNSTSIKPIGPFFLNSSTLLSLLSILTHVQLKIMNSLLR